MHENKKAYLKQYRHQEKVICTLTQMIITSPENRDKYQLLIDRSYDIRRDIENKISAVDDTVLRELLYNKYIFGKTLEQISCILNYSKRHIERLHIKALEKFQM